MQVNDPVIGLGGRRERAGGDVESDLSAESQSATHDGTQEGSLNYLQSATGDNVTLLQPTHLSGMI